MPRWTGDQFPQPVAAPDELIAHIEAAGLHPILKALGGGTHTTETRTPCRWWSALKGRVDQARPAFLERVAGSVLRLDPEMWSLSQIEHVGYADSMAAESCWSRERSGSTAAEII